MGGYKIEFLSEPFQITSQKHFNHLNQTNENMVKEIQKLLQNKAIGKCQPSEGQFLSTFFLRQKPDGSHRFILNLKDLNFFIKKEHFKIEDLKTAINILEPNNFMARLDLKDAYFLIPIHKEHQKFLTFSFNDQLYKFKALPFGLSSAPLIFTKLIKPILNFLRSRGVKAIAYLDDFLILADSVEECKQHLSLLIDLLTRLGFIINWGKSELRPSRRCKFLGMIIDSQRMLLELPLDRRVKIHNLICQTLQFNKIKIQNLAELIGVLVAASPAIAYGWLYYKNLEKMKTEALIANDKNNQALASLSPEAVKELKWWEAHVLTSVNKIRSTRFDYEIYSDASTTGWGATLGNKTAHGLWDARESKMHINFLEIKAALLGLMCFAKRWSNKQILLRIDNVTALAYINKMGGTKNPENHKITMDLWEWCQERDIWVFAEYVASKDNVADEGSRINNADTEWEINPKAFNIICSNLGKPTIDLFATRINKKCQKYCSWERDPQAWAINALTVSWKNEFWYAFPPFALIPKILKKITSEGSSGILVVPYWTNQPWFPKFKKLLVSDLFTLNPSNELLLSPCRKRSHHLAEHLTLAYGILSSKYTRKRTWTTHHHTY